ncbi:glycoside hydrolase family 2 protein [Ornithobacterium rhinotracheale]|uniref:beta-mannosidase n=1 Tax=Ornithobacterium rhinotracheale TaxID=28251 RepID=UPI001FF67166|nr:glycoside hydrolase family 2 protein [Ornithobacterium rhinotracheale]MCK0202836.1 glycoside hydrolase family 2 protein [Ornithobacterium rhinotracheale]
MRNFFLLLNVLIMSLSFSQKSISLNQDWQFAEVNSEKWYKIDIPTSVQQALIQHKILPPPYEGTNEEKIQWVEDKDWIFIKDFEIQADDLKFPNILLQLTGLDTFADVFLNEHKILHAQNMFVPHNISVKKYLKAGKNTLKIKFYSPIKYNEPKRLAAGFEYPADNDHRTEKVSVYSRKAPYHFGWDWGIRIAQMGIWRPVYLQFLNEAYITDYFVEQKEVSEKKAVIQNHLQIKSDKDFKANIVLNIRENGKTISSIQRSFDIVKGSNSFLLPIDLNQPKLWQPNGWGKQNLYDFSIEIKNKDKTISSKNHKIGIRKIELVREKEPKGESFYFKVNGNPIFAKGANYIPGETLKAQQDSTYYERLFKNVVAANMNMLRVWGGGIYENDYFYELADRYGILIWQDFMFACTPYPSDSAFLDNVEEEAISNIKRLRNYACVALWCGNNEVEESIKYWGFEKRVPADAYQNFFHSYDQIFKTLLPDLVKKYAPETPYIHGSPLIANWGRPATWAYGDSHYWGVWYGRQPFEILDKNVPRFMSEFGFQAFPEEKTLRTFADEKDFALDSKVIQAHQKSSTGNDAIKEYMERYYRMPENFSDFVYLGLVLQGEGMKKGMLAHRRNRPYCMGSLYWQLNDSWPVVSWSSVDYYNNWKALHYKAREAFAPIAVDAYQNSDTQKYDFYIFSDELKNIPKANLEVKLMDFSGKILKKWNFPTDVLANQTQKVASLNLKNIADEKTMKNAFLVLNLKDQKGKTLAQDNFYFLPVKELNLPKNQIHTKLKFKNGKYYLKLKTDKLAKNVFVEIPILGVQFSDNFFDLLPNETKTIEISSPELNENHPPTIKIRQVRDTYQ